MTAGRHVVVLDNLLHDQEAVRALLDAQGAEVVRADLRDADARARAIEGAEAVVHLAAIVGDPACARDPQLAEAVNIDGTRGLLEDARRAGVERLVFASTCSNYGRMSDPTVPADEDGELAPLSLYAQQKVAIEQLLLGAGLDGLAATCLRLATLYGAAPRMRFDLTVNEFTRDLWAARRLEVFGKQFWRPYVHVRDAARAIRGVLDAPSSQVAGRVFNVGRTTENYRKADLVEIIRERVDRGEVAFVHRDEDPRDYKVSFDRIARELGFRTTMTVPDGVAEVIAALEAGRFGDPFAAAHSNI